jgi:hypothetical protein
MMIFGICTHTRATALLEFWKRKERTLAMLWGTSNFEANEVTRVEFKPLYELPSIVTGAPEMYYPWSSTALKLATSAVVVLISVISVATVFVLLTSIASIIRSVGDIPDDEALVSVQSASTLQRQLTARTPLGCSQLANSSR